MTTIKLKRRPFPVRLRIHYRIARQHGLSFLDSIRAAWFVASA